ncbi:Gluconolactonase precursor [Posidoniimonas polymericola]|uniref:Gluconolactonase n=1 Tax=Posidoniimonas polymericola TaxID=2528002 RepID=A0A5C5YT75_9BACT|nr:SMP-30/gluconolactonase/LRE family protein [Posidoniimonas polymericola]TWT77980.1 Gluconolactonase precursor [Posidoniimonas polymericola]
MQRFSPLLVALLVIANVAYAADPIPGVGPAGAVERVSLGHTFVEGPAWDGAGRLYFTDIPSNTIHVLEQGRVTAFTTESRRANGLMLAADGRLVACEMSGALVAYDTKTKARTVLASEFKGKPFNAPNDLVIDRTGGVYFTDPMFGAPALLPQGQQGVYYLPAGGDQAVSVAQDLKAPNGVLLSPDENTLYVLPSASPVMLAYAVESPGRLGPAREFCRTKGGPNEGSDGGAMDSQGNVYLTTSSGVQVFSSAGDYLGTIELPEHPANCTFGGPDLKTLYVTARTSLYAVPMEVVGHRYAPREPKQ